MGKLSDVLAFEKFNLKGIGKKIKDDPERLLIGAVDPASSKAWGKVTGKDYEPMVDQWGGASSDTYDKAEKSGINTNAGKSMHQLARGIAGFFAGSYGADKLGMLSSSGEVAGNGMSIPQAGSSSQGLQIGQVSSVSDMGAMTAGEQMGAAGGSGMTGSSSSIAPEVGSSIPQGSAINGSSKGYDWGQAGRAMQNYGEQQEEQQPLNQDEVTMGADGELHITSTKAAKVAAPTDAALVRRGATGEDPISENGLQVASIQELDDRFNNIESRLKALIARKKQG